LAFLGLGVNGFGGVSSSRLTVALNRSSSDFDFFGGLAMGYIDLDNLRHEPKIAESLGNMVVAWARAESVLTNTFACVVNIHLNMAIMAFSRVPTFEAKIKVVRAALTEWKPKQYDRDAIDKAVDKLSKLARARNDWVHGVWCRDQEGRRETVIFDFRAPEADGRRKPVAAPDIENHIEAVKKRTADLLALVKFPHEPGDA
jgi:hypothetical protein